VHEGEAELVAGSAQAEEERSYEFHCGQAAAELCAAAAVFWGVEVGKERKSEGNGSRGFL